MPTLQPLLQHLRLEAAEAVPAKEKSALGQFFTPEGVSAFMAGMFERLVGDVHILDPGCGVGSLFSAAVAEAVQRGGATRIELTAFELDRRLKGALAQSVAACKALCQASGVPFDADVRFSDFLLDNAGGSLLTAPRQQEGGFSHVIMNPPYKKINTKSPHRQAIQTIGVETVNLYTGFMAMGIHLLRPGGEMVAIVPRSFCNGLYYLPFRRYFLREMGLTRLHLFEKRDQVFDDVLQENIILHAVKGRPQGRVTISTSMADQFSAGTSLSTREVPFSDVVKPHDKQLFIHIVPKAEDQAIVDQVSHFSHTLGEIGLEVSTGPVVDFRCKADLRSDPEPGAVPLLYPQHFNGDFHWPKEGKKPNAIRVSSGSRPWLWVNEGCYVITRRFSSKEERRRIYAYVYDGTLPGDLIGFENKLNVFHRRKKGLSPAVARGLCVYLNSTLLDQYYRQFGGHTQVNATDLRNIPYPSLADLKWLGSQAEGCTGNQAEIDRLVSGLFHRNS